MILSPDIADRLHAKLDKSGDCWLWAGNTNDKGYGYIVVNGKRERVHRVAYALYHGGLPKGLQVEHECRKRNCANPAHLRLATNKQNMENIGSRKDSAVPYRGVTRQYRKKIAGYVYIAGVIHNGAYHYCGQHTSAETAHEAVKAKRLELFTHNSQDK